MNKFYAKKTLCANEHIHDSKGEAIRCNQLHLMQNNGKIKGLIVQPQFEIIDKFVSKGSMNTSERPARYTADFEYYEGDLHIVEDYKSKYTVKEKDYILRRKLFKKLYCKNDEIIFREVVI